MNIGFIEDTNLRGGTQIWVVEATKYFLSVGHNVFVICPKDSFVAKNCKKVGAKIFEYDWDDIAVNKEKYSKIWTEGLLEMDVAICTVHPPRNNFHCSVFAGKCLKENQLNTILITKTGTIVPQYKREFYIPNDFIRTEVICITNFTRNYLIKNYNLPTQKVHLIYQGTEIDRFTSTEKTKKEAFLRYKLPEKRTPIIASIGSLEKRKGQIVLLEAIKSLLEENKLPNIHAMIVGEGPDENMLKGKVSELKLENNVTFFPFTNEPNYIFDRIDVLVLSSINKEGLPNVLLESMSMGIPVVSSDIAGVSEIVFDGETGYKVKAGDKDELAQAIIKIWSDKKRYKKMQKNSRKLMESKFDKKVQFKKFLDFFSELKF